MIPMRSQSAPLGQIRVAITPVAMLKMANGSPTANRPITANVATFAADCRMPWLEAAAAGHQGR